MSFTAYAVLNKKTHTDDIFFVVQRLGNGNAMQCPAYKEGHIYFSNSDATKGEELHKLTHTEIEALSVNNVAFWTDEAE